MEFAPSAKLANRTRHGPTSRHVGSIRGKADVPGVPFRVETLTADAGGFQLQVSTITPGDPGKNEIQRSFYSRRCQRWNLHAHLPGRNHRRDCLQRQCGHAPIRFGSVVQHAPGDVIVTGTSPTWSVEFGGNYANANVPLLTGNGTTLAGAASLIIETLSEGSATSNEIRRASPQHFLFDPFAFAWNVNSSNREFSVSLSAIGLPAAQAQSAIEGISGIGSGNVIVRVVGSFNPNGLNTYDIEFVGDLGGQNLQPLLEIADPVTQNGLALPTIQEGGGGPTNEVQTVRINGSPTGGTFTLTFQGQTTGPIASGADAATLEAASKPSPISTMSPSL